MTTTPLLGITELTPNQSGKEVTINNAILALEAAMNANLAVSLAAGNATLSAAQFTNNFLFKLTGATVQRTLNIPAQVNGVNVQRLFAVRNSSGWPAVVQVTGAPGTSVTIPNTESRLLDVDGAGNVKTVAMPAYFTTLPDVPNSYTGQSKKLLRVKSTEDGIEFRSAQLADLTVDVDTTTTPPSDGMVLVYSASQSKWIPGTVTTGGGGGSGSGVASIATKPATGLAAIFPTVANALTVTEVAGKGLYLTGAAATQQLRYATKPLTTGVDTSVVACVRGFLKANFNSIGLIVRDAATGKSIVLAQINNGTNQPYCEASSWTTDTTGITAIGNGGTNPYDTAYLKINYTAATKAIDCFWSTDGVTWAQIVTGNVFLANPSDIGILLGCRNVTATNNPAGYIMSWNDGVQSFDFDPYTVNSLNIGTVSLSYRLGFGFEDNIASANYIIGRHTCVEAFSIPANFANSVASIALNPLATMTITLKKNGTTIGTVTISTAGAMTFATTGGLAINCAIGDVITASVGAADANAAGFAMTLKA